MKLHGLSFDLIGKMPFTEETVQSPSTPLSSLLLRKGHVILQQEKWCLQPNRRLPTRGEPYWHCSLRCSVSRTVRKCISVDGAIQFAIFCYGSPSCQQVFNRCWRFELYFVIFVHLISMLVFDYHSSQGVGTQSQQLPFPHFDFLDAGTGFQPTPQPEGLEVREGISQALSCACPAACCRAWSFRMKNFLHPSHVYTFILCLVLFFPSLFLLETLDKSPKVSFRGNLRRSFLNCFFFFFPEVMSLYIRR